MDDIMLTKVFKTISKQYQSSETKESINNCIKVLLRCLKMYEA